MLSNLKSLLPNFKQDKASVVFVDYWIPADYYTPEACAQLESTMREEFNFNSIMRRGDIVYNERLSSISKHESNPTMCVYDGARLVPTLFGGLVMLPREFAVFREFPLYYWAGSFRNFNRIHTYCKPNKINKSSRFYVSVDRDVVIRQVMDTLPKIGQGLPFELVKVQINFAGVDYAVELFHMMVDKIQRGLEISELRVRCMTSSTRHHHGRIFETYFAVSVGG